MTTLASYTSSPTCASRTTPPYFLTTPTYGAPSYSATKGYQRLFTESLAQTAHHEKLKIKFTTIIPGFVDTDLIKDQKYPLTLPLKKAVRIIAKGLLKQKRYVFVDGKWRFIVFTMRLVPNWVWERML